MKTLHISVDKKKVIDEVQMLSSYVAAKASEPTEFQNLAINDFDEAWVNSTIESCHIELTNILSEYIVGEVYGNDTYEFMLEVPDNIHPQSEKNINASAPKYYASAILAEWFTMLGKDIATTYISNGAAYLDIIRSNIHRRDKPIRRPLSPF